MDDRINVGEGARTITDLNPIDKVHGFLGETEVASQFPGSIDCQDRGCSPCNGPDFRFTLLAITVDQTVRFSSASER